MITFTSLRSTLSRGSLLWRYAVIVGLLLAVCTITYLTGWQNNAPIELQTEPFKVPGPESLCPDYRKEDSAERIVYVESSGNECLTARQACGVESASRANPNMRVDVYFNTRRIGDRDAEQDIQRRSCAFNAVALGRSNVNVIKENFASKLRNTPFWGLIETRKLPNSPWSSVQLSDLMRIVYLNETGGIYLDFDVMVLRPLHCLRNTLSYLTIEIEASIENGIMAMDAGHPFLKYLSQNLESGHKKEFRTSLGAPAYGQAFKTFCNQGTLKTGTYQCPESSVIKLIESDAFFPVKYHEQQYFYGSRFDKLDKRPMEKAFVAHVYKANWGSVAHRDSLYARLARQYCPSVWELAVRENGPHGF